MSASLNYTWTPSRGHWAVALEVLPNASGGSFLVSTDSGLVAQYSLTARPQPVASAPAHRLPVTTLQAIDAYTVVLGAADGIKVWDLRAGLAQPVAQPALSPSSPVLSLAVLPDKTNLAIGSELLGQDAYIHVYDVRQWAPVRQFADLHQDDVTSLEYHPTKPYLMLGSTDGCVNVYNMAEPDEDEALHQVAKYASVHLCHFTRDNRFSVLSHMETLSFWELNNTDYEHSVEPLPRDLGDVREAWPGCSYVVDLFPSYVVYGSNSDLLLTLVPFDAAKEKFKFKHSIDFPGAHGEEVVRGFRSVDESSVLSCGEDGTVKAWTLPERHSEKAKKKAEGSKHKTGKSKGYKPY